MAPNAEEVLSLGHLYEQGAHDNATGVASIIGAAETINRLIKEGKLPRPKRTIRVLGMGECYGTICYLEHNMDRVKRTIAAMCIDSPAGLQNLAGTEYTWILNPHSATSYVDAFTLRLAEEYYPSVGRPWLSLAHRSSTDNYLGDPSIGIPTVMPYGGYGVLAHHNSGDTPATVDPRSMRDMMVMNAAYTYFLASAGPAEKRWMAEVALTRGYSQVGGHGDEMLDQMALAKTADELGRLLRKRRRASTTSSSASPRRCARRRSSTGDSRTSPLRAAAEGARGGAIRDRAAALNLGTVPPFVPPRNPEAEAIVVRRKRMGTITLDNLPREQREGFPGRVVLGRAGLGAVLVRRQAHARRSHPAHRARDGPADVRLRRLLQVPREERLRRVREVKISRTFDTLVCSRGAHLAPTKKTWPLLSPRDEQASSNE